MLPLGRVQLPICQLSKCFRFICCLSEDMLGKYQEILQLLYFLHYQACLPEICCVPGCFFSKVVIRCACRRATWLRGRYCLISHRKAVHQYGVEHPCNRKQCAWKTQRSMAKLMTIVDMCNFPTVYLLAVKAQQVALTLVSLVSKIS